MKFFEAVELGWGLVTPAPGTSATCALGMAHYAVGGAETDPIGICRADVAMWPWLKAYGRFNCPACGMECRRGAEVVTHLFDHHLYQTPGLHMSDISRDQFIDYLRQLEEQATGQGLGTGEQVVAEIESPTESALVTV